MPVTGESRNLIGFCLFLRQNKPFFLRGALPRTLPGYRPGPKLGKGGAAPFETPARGQAPLDPPYE